jgi:hypothetical protein
MSEFLIKILIGQYEAVLAMMKLRIEACPSEYWEGKISEATFRQDAYHALFWFYYYLSSHEDQFVMTDLHTKGGDERRPVISQGLSKDDTLEFVELCRKWIYESLPQETEESLEGNSGFPSIFKKYPLTRAELHIYNIRHLQHHMAQESMYLRKISDEHDLSLELPWIGTGWR